MKRTQKNFYYKVAPACFGIILLVALMAVFNACKSRDASLVGTADKPAGTFKPEPKKSVHQ